MMKYNLFLLIASSLLLQATLSRSVCITNHYDVYIRNSLPAGSPPLNVHCLSGDDGLGYHDLTQNAEYHFDFCENAVATMFTCHFKWNGKDKGFHVYDARHGGSDLCNKGICYYSVADDGFHFSNVYPPDQGRFFCDWNPNSSCN